MGQMSRAVSERRAPVRGRRGGGHLSARGNVLPSGGCTPSNSELTITEDDRDGS